MSLLNCVSAGVYQRAKGHKNSRLVAFSFAIWAQGSAGVVALTEAVAALATAARAATAESRDIMGDITSRKGSSNSISRVQQDQTNAVQNQQRDIYIMMRMKGYQRSTAIVFHCC